MPQKPIVILHGWSDNAQSFRLLATLVAKQLKRPTQLINLADYVSMEDHVLLDDLIDAMQTAWLKSNLPITPFSVDAIVHSFGAMVIRGWLARYYQAHTSPVKNMVMLAPANFGSPLAHKGRALIGRIIRGFRSPHLFQVGANILRALEIASPRAWQLAQLDRFGQENYYDRDAILCTVLCGNKGLSGLAAAANEPGTDGVVRVSSSNMNCAQLQIDYTLTNKNNQLAPKMQWQKAQGQTAFAILDNVNHDTIIATDQRYVQSQTFQYLIRGLTVRDAEFNDWCHELATHNNTLIKTTDEQLSTQAFQNTITYLHDQYQHPITDYFIEFFAGCESHANFAERFHSEVIQSVHAYQDNPAYRSLFINITLLQQLVRNSCPDMQINITALPQLADHIVGYPALDPQHQQGIMLDKKQIKQWFQENRTLFVEIKLARKQHEQLFQFRKLTKR